MSGDATGDMLCGMAAGISGKLVDYPFDTIKTRMQMPGAEEQYGSAWKCITTTARGEGIRGFYAGIGAPIAGEAVAKAFVFTAYSGGKRLYDVLFQSSVSSNTPAAETITRCTFGGAVAGVATGLWNTPVELVKCRVQVYPGRWRGVVHCAKETFTTGGVKTLMRGLTPCLGREVCGNAVWFGSYESILRSLTPPGVTREKTPMWIFPFSGGCAGLVYCLSFPFDTVKTQMQVNDAAASRSMAENFRTIVKTGGVKALFRGIDVTLLRSFPASAAVFASYELFAAQWRHAMHHPGPACRRYSSCWLRR
jgi:ornithine carrier protein